MQFLKVTLIGGALVLMGACGDNATERAATGGLGGAVVAGPVGAVAGATVGAALSMGGVAAQTLAGISAWNLAWFGVYFVLGFLLYAAVMGAIGASVNNIREAQPYMTPVMSCLSAG